MGSSDVQLLLSVNFLHFVSAGLISPVLTQHICQNGGNHVIVGLLVAALFISNKISKGFVTLFNHGNNFCLKFCLFSSFITYVLLVVNYNLWMIFLDRCFYVLTNRVSFLSKDYVANIQSGETQMNNLNLLEVTEVAGIVLGAISGGYMFEFSEDFRVIAISASIITLLALVLLQYVDGDNPTTSTTTNDLLLLPTICYDKIQNLKTADYADKWTRIILLSTYTFSISAYFSRFVFLLTSNYHIGAVIVGYSIAYQFMWKFFCDCAAPLLKDQIANKNSLFECSLVVCAVTLSGLYYAPNYETFLIVFIPMMVTNSLINSLLHDDVLQLENDGLGDVVNTITDFIHIFGPIFFGVLCHVYEADAFKLLVVLPVVACGYLMQKKFEHRDSREDKAKEN